MNDLTAKQAAFVAAYLETGHIKNAAIRAGYSRSGAHVEGSRLLKNPKVLAKIVAARKQAEDAAAFTLGEAIAILASIARSDEHPMARIRAIETAGRLLSWEVQQGDVTLRVEYVNPSPPLSVTPKPSPEPEPTPPPEPKPKPMAKLYS
jgi:phage terminase small subunit